VVISLPFFWAIVLRSEEDHMWLIVAEDQAFLSRKVSLIDFFVLYFLVRIDAMFSHQKQTVFVCFFFFFSKHHVIKVLLQKEKWVSCFHEVQGVLWSEATMVAQIG